MRAPLWKDWPAQVPPEGFSSRTVDRLLQEDKKVVPLRRRRRWFLVLGCAAALAGGTSWAMMSYMPIPKATESFDSEVDSEVELPDPPAAPPIVRLASSRAEKAPSATVAPPPTPILRPPVSTSASASTAVSAEPPKVLLVPRCICEPGSYICSCVH